MSYFETPAIGKKFIVRSVDHTENFVKVLIKHFKDKGYKKTGIITTEDVYFESYVNAFKKLAPTIDVIYSCLPDDHDFKPLIAKLRNSKVDSLIVLLFPGQVSSFFKQYRAIDKKLPIIGTDIFESKEEILASGDLINGSVYAIPEVSNTFYNSYINKYNDFTHSVWAYNAYIFANMTYKLFSKNTGVKLSPEQIISKVVNIDSDIFKIKNLANTGSYMSFPIVLKQIKNNKPMVIR